MTPVLRIGLLASSAALAACAGSRPLPRVAPPPPVALELAAPAAPQRRMEPPSADADEAATSRWLAEAIERERRERPNLPPVPLQQTVYVERPVWQERIYGPGYDEFGAPVYGYEPWQRNDWRTTPFPVNTLIGATVGAYTGHGGHSRSRDIAIGAGIGLLFDLARWY
jgi:hypothetical protein